MRRILGVRDAISGEVRARGYENTMSTVVAAVFEAELSAEQARELARLMDEMRATRPEAVVVATLLYEEPHATLIAVWPSRGAFDLYLATTEVPRGAELMRMVGAEPTMRVVDVLEHA